MRARIWEAEGFSLVTFPFSSFLGGLENKRQLRREDITHQLHLEWGSFFPPFIHYTHGYGEVRRMARTRQAYMDFSHGSKNTHPLVKRIYR